MTATATETETGMKLSQETLAVLKNFASLNSNILIRPGNSIATVTPVKNVMAEATVDETFDIEFGIWDLNKFLGVISLFKEPMLTFGEKSVVISDATRKNAPSVNYYYCEPSLLTAPKKSITMPDILVSFKLTADNVAEIMRASSVLQVGDISVRGTKDKIEVVVFDKADKGSNTYSIVVGENKAKTKFDIHMKVDNLKLMSGDYDVHISKSIVAKFSHCSKDLTYFVALEATSSTASKE
jgi:hypothetical protein